MTRATDDAAATPRGEAAPPAAELNGAFLTTYDRRLAGSARILQSHPAEGEAEVELAGAVSGVAPASRLAPAPTAGAAAQPEAILDDSNLLPFAFLRTGDRVGRCVVKIERADRAAGTGFLVAPDILLTNHHVLPDAPTAAGARALANYEASPPADPAGRPASVALDPEGLFVTNAELDFTFCGVRGLDHLGTVAVERDSLLIMPSEYVNIIQHPRGRPKEVALQDSRVVKVDPVVVHYSCDTEPGSSGSPVFNNRWRLVALHHASVPADAAAGGRVGAGLPAGSRYLNEGIRLSAIALWLESAEANAPAHREGVSRVRRVFADLDPQVGYFGALGRSAGGRSAAELVVDAYRTRGDRLDVAYWDAGHLGEAAADRLHELGWALAGMGVDVWLLAHLAPGLSEALAEHLDTHFRLDYRALRSPGPAGDALVALVRRGATRRAEWRDATVEGCGCADCGAAGAGAPRPRLLIQAAGPRRPAYRLVIAPVGDRGSAVGDEGGAARRAATAPGTRPAAGVTRPCAGADLLLLGDALAARDLHGLAGRAPALQAALGPDGGVALVPAPGSPVASLFVSPNLEGTVGGPGPLVVAGDRRWPAALAALGGSRPVAARLALGPAPAPIATPTPAPAGRRLRADAAGTPAPHLRPPLAPFRAADDDAADDPAVDPGIASLLDDEGLEDMLRSLLDALRSRKAARSGEAEPAGPAPDAG
jgi:hypothetical protein